MNRQRFASITALPALVTAFFLALAACPSAGGGNPGVTLVSIAVASPPAKTSYTVGETFDPAGLVITAAYSDGTAAPVTGYALSEPDMSTEGTKTVTVSYQGKTAAFDIAVRNINITFAQLQDTSAVIAPAAVSRSGARTADIALAGAEGYTDIQWSVDGEAAGTGGSFTVDAWDYALGTHSVTVELKKDGAPYSKTVAFTVNK